MYSSRNLATIYVLEESDGAHLMAVKSTDFSFTKLSATAGSLSSAILGSRRRQNERATAASSRSLNLPPAFRISVWGIDLK